MGDSGETNGVVRFWLRLGAVSAAALSIIALAAVLQRTANGEVNARLDEIAETVNLVAGAIVEPDSVEQARIVRDLRRKLRAVR